MVTFRPSLLSPEEQARIESAIATAESRSAAELVVVVARHSASYAVYSALWATSLALLAGWIAAFLAPTMALSHLAVVQGVVLLGCAAVLFLTPLGVMLVPASVKQARAATLARLEFAHRVNKRTRRKDGVLLFLSLGEHYVEIIADDAVAAVIPAEHWQQIVRRFIGRTKGTRIVDSLHDLIKDCGAILAERFPARAGQANELPDRVTEI